MAIFATSNGHFATTLETPLPVSFKIKLTNQPSEDETI